MLSSIAPPIAAGHIFPSEAAPQPLQPSPCMYLADFKGQRQAMRLVLNDPAASMRVGANMTREPCPSAAGNHPYSDLKTGNLFLSDLYIIERSDLPTRSNRSLKG